MTEKHHSYPGCAEHDRDIHEHEHAHDVIPAPQVPSLEPAPTPVKVEHIHCPESTCPHCPENDPRHASGIDAVSPFIPHAAVQASAHGSLPDGTRDVLRRAQAALGTAAAAKGVRVGIEETPPDESTIAFMERMAIVIYQTRNEDHTKLYGSTLAPWTELAEWARDDYRRQAVEVVRLSVIWTRERIARVFDKQFNCPECGKLMDPAISMPRCSECGETMHGPGIAFEIRDAMLFEGLVDAAPANEHEGTWAVADRHGHVVPELRKKSKAAAEAIANLLSNFPGQFHAVDQDGQPAPTVDDVLKFLRSGKPGTVSEEILGMVADTIEKRFT